MMCSQFSMHVGELGWQTFTYLHAKNFVYTSLHPLYLLQEADIISGKHDRISRYRSFAWLVLFVLVK